MKDESPTWCIALTLVDEENNGFVTLGGAGWKSEAAWESQWAEIAVSPLGTEACVLLVADKLDSEGDIVEEKFVTSGTVEFLLGRPLADLIAEGRSNTPFTVKQVLEKYPELANSFKSFKYIQSLDSAG